MILTLNKGKLFKTILPDCCFIFKDIPTPKVFILIRLALYVYTHDYIYRMHSIDEYAPVQGFFITSHSIGKNMTTRRVSSHGVYFSNITIKFYRKKS